MIRNWYPDLKRRTGPCKYLQICQPKEGTSPITTVIVAWFKGKNALKKIGTNMM